MIKYLNKLPDEYNNTNIHSIGKNLPMLIILLGLKKSRQILKLLNLKLVLESRLLCTKIFSAIMKKSVVK